MEREVVVRAPSVPNTVSLIGRSDIKAESGFDSNLLPLPHMVASSGAHTYRGFKYLPPRSPKSRLKVHSCIKLGKMNQVAKAGLLAGETTRDSSTREIRSADKS